MNTKTVHRTYLACGMARTGMTGMVRTGIGGMFIQEYAHSRGYEFEVWLNELFKVFRMAPRGSFRNTGEQIDGSFRMDGSYYLMEAKWHSKETPASDLHAFQGKLNGKASWTRGVFISWQGFSSDGLTAFGNGNRIVCISGKDIHQCLKSKIPFPVLLEAKLRHASETGACYVAYDDIKNLPKS